jgi:WD40 repeat protein
LSPSSSSSLPASPRHTRSSERSCIVLQHGCFKFADFHTRFPIVVAAEQTGQVRVHEVRRHATILHPEPKWGTFSGAPVSGCSWAPDRNCAVASVGVMGCGGSAGCVKIYDVLGSVYDLSASSSAPGLLLSHALTRGSLWCHAWAPHGAGRLALGCCAKTMGQAQVLDLGAGAARVCARYGRALHTDVLSQAYIPTSPTVILNGCRNGSIVEWDTRHAASRSGGGHQHAASNARPRQHGSSSSSSMKQQGQAASVCWLHSMNNGIHILSSNMANGLEVLDRRMCMRSVRQFRGHMNSHTRLQCCVDREERIVVAGGEDGMVRAWSLGTGNLLHAADLAPTASKPGHSQYENYHHQHHHHHHHHQQQGNHQPLTITPYSIAMQYGQDQGQRGGGETRRRCSSHIRAIQGRPVSRLERTPKSVKDSAREHLGGSFDLALATSAGLLYRRT